MSECITAKESECSKGWFPTKIDLVQGCFGFERVGEGAVFDPGHMTNSLGPKGSGERFDLKDLLGIGNH